MSVDVYATSKAMPSAWTSFPASAASLWPVSDRGQSYQPVNRFSRFHVDSPWRISSTELFDRDRAAADAARFSTRARPSMFVTVRARKE